MKKRAISTALFVSLIVCFAVTASAQINDPVKAFKGYINEMVQKVEHADRPEMKRKIMNNTFNELLSAFEKAEDMRTLSPKDQKALNLLTKSIMSKKNELNGWAGYKKVPNYQLNEFAHFVQQDMEQAETITISIVVALLVVIILLLL